MLSTDGRKNSLNPAGFRNWNNRRPIWGFEGKNIFAPFRLSLCNYREEREFCCAHNKQNLKSLSERTRPLPSNLFPVRRPPLTPPSAATATTGNRSSFSRPNRRSETQTPPPSLAATPFSLHDDNNPSSQSNGRLGWVSSNQHYISTSSRQVFEASQANEMNELKCIT